METPSPPVPPPIPSLPVELGGLTPSHDELNWGMLCHLLAFCGFLVPLGNIIGPLVMWLLKKDVSPWVDYHGREALNFQITLTIAGIISAILVIVLIGILLLPALMIFGLVFMIIATIKAKEGVRYRYPVCLRFL